MNEVAETGKPARRTPWWMIVLGTAIVVVAACWGISRVFRHESISARLTSVIASQLGEGSSIGRVDVEWKKLDLFDLFIPLNRCGSRLRIPRIEAELQPLAVVRKGRFEPIVRAVYISGADLALVRDETTGNANQPWLPSFALPQELVDVLSRFGGLDKVVLQDGTIRAVAGPETTLVASRLNCVVVRSGKNVFQWSGTGIVQSDSSRRFYFSGELDASRHQLRADATADIPKYVFAVDKRQTATLSGAGGRAAFELTVTDSGAKYVGIVHASSLAFAAASQTIRCDSLTMQLAGDSLALDAVEFGGSSLQGRLQGSLQLRGDGALRLNGSITDEDLSVLESLLHVGLNISGQSEAVYTISGNLRSPSCRLKFGSSDISIDAYRLRDVHGEVIITRESAEIRSLSCVSDAGDLQAQGRIGLAKPGEWNAEGTVNFSEMPELFGWKTGIRRLRFSGGGTLLSPILTVSVCDTGANEICTGLLQKSGAGWRMQVESAGGDAGNLAFEPTANGFLLSGNSVHRLVMLFVPDYRAALYSVKRLDIRFHGNPRGGDLECDVETLPDSVKFLPRVAREFHLSGKYDRPDTNAVKFDGQWSGIAGNGDTFEGRARLALQNRILTFDQFFVDAAGQLTGNVDFRNRDLNLEIAVSDLLLTRLPVPTAFLKRAQLQGTLAGHLRMHGSLDHPEWSANLAMINGSAFGVPEYWLNLEANGIGQAAVIRNFELGRGVRKIIAASGEIDGRTRQVALTAEVGAARAEDFVLALTGWRGILSGELDGRGTAVGTLPGIDVETEFQVRQGSLLNEIYFDEFTASFQLVTDESGLRTLRIPQCTFTKQATYEFSGSAEVLPKDNQTLTAHVEGSGDFLDILDQMDRAFRTKGSRGSFQLDLGGTLSKPRLLGGHLSVPDGHFIYPDATPGTISTQIAIHAGNTGVVDTGIVHFGSGNQWIEVRALPECDSAEGTLKPITIRGAQLCLGFLEIRTGDNGMPLRVPGLMKEEWLGDFVTGADGVQPITISAFDENRLLIEGGVRAGNARITFPFVGSGSGPMRRVARWIVNRLIEAQWNLDVAVSTGNHYDVEITGLKNSEIFAPLRNSPVFARLADYFDHLSIDAILDPTDHPLQIRGTIADTSFYLNGQLSSHRGKVEYLDQTFTVDYVNSDFDETDVMPILEGRATTTGQDTLGRQVPVYLTMYQIDRETGTRQKRGRLSNITYVLEDDAGDTPEQTLGLLGYNIGDMKNKAEELVASTVVRTIGRQWLDPLERRLERWTLLDEVTLSPGKGRWSSLSRQQRERAQADTLTQNSAVRFFTGSQVTVGKYLTRDLFFTYTGELAEGQIELGGRLGFVHLWNLEYRIYPLSRDLVLDLAVEYDEVERRRDESVSLKYSFALEQ
jgi:hypothetical protein